MQCVLLGNVYYLRSTHALGARLHMITLQEDRHKV